MKATPDPRRHLKMAVALLAAVLLSTGLPAADDPLDAIPDRLQPFIAAGEISGAVSLLADRDQVLHLSAVGTSHLASGRPMQTDDLFWIASMSKPITAVAIGLLVDDGKLSFDDPVEKFLPEYADLWVLQEQSAGQRILVTSTRPITLRDLLTHTSGLGEYRVTDPHWTLGQLSAVLAREPLRFQPGSRWGYSTAGTDLLGRVAEVASGTPLAEFLQTRLFDPLGMKDTTFWPTADQYRRLAQDYRPGPEPHTLVETAVGYLYGGSITDRQRPPLGGAGLFSTATDIAAFYQMMLNEGAFKGRQILTPATVAEMTRKQTGDLRARSGMPWGLGFCVIEDPSQMEANATLSPGTFGHGGAHGTNSWADPMTGLVYVFMIQREALRPNPDNSPMRRAYQDAIAAARPAR